MADESKTVVVAPPVAVEKRKNTDMLDLIEQKVVARSAGIVEDALLFQQWPHDDPDLQRAIYESWRDDPSIGPQRAMERVNMCKAAWKGKKDAPVGLDIARSIMVASMKARATKEAGGVRTMNVQMVQMTAPLPDFRRKLVEE